LIVLLVLKWSSSQILVRAGAHPPVFTLIAILPSASSSISASVDLSMPKLRAMATGIVTMNEFPRLEIRTLEGSCAFSRL
jgi:hypothetical protein